MNNELDLKELISSRLQTNCQLLKSFITDQYQRRCLLDAIKFNNINKILKKGLDGTVISFNSFRNDKCEREFLQRFGNAIRKKFEDSKMLSPIIDNWSVVNHDPRFMESKINSNTKVNRNLRPAAECIDTENDDISFFLPQLNLDKTEIATVTSLIELDSLSNYLSYNTRKLLNMLYTNMRYTCKSTNKKIPPNKQTENSPQKSIEEIKEIEKEDETFNIIINLIDRLDRKNSGIKNINIVNNTTKLIEDMSPVVAEIQVIVDEIDTILVETVDGDSVRNGHKFHTLLLKYGTIIETFDLNKADLIKKLIDKKNDRLVTKLHKLEKMSEINCNNAQKKYDHAKIELANIKVEILTKLNTNKINVDMLKEQGKNVSDSEELKKTKEKYDILTNQEKHLNNQLKDVAAKIQKNEEKKLQELAALHSVSENSKMIINENETASTLQLTSAIHEMKLNVSRTSIALLTIAKTHSINSTNGSDPPTLSDGFRSPTLLSNDSSEQDFKCFLEPLHHFKIATRRGSFNVRSMILGIVCENCMSLIFDLETSKIKIKNNFDFNNKKKMKDIREMYIQLIKASTTKDDDILISKKMFNSGPNSIMTKLSFDTTKSVLVYRPSFD